MFAIPIALVGLVSCSVPIMTWIPVGKRGYVVHRSHRHRRLQAVLQGESPVLMEASEDVVRQAHTAVMITTAVVRTVGVAGAYLASTSVAQFKFFCADLRSRAGRASLTRLLLKSRNQEVQYEHA